MENEDVNGWKIFRDPDYYDMWVARLTDSYSTIHSAFFNSYEDAVEFSMTHDRSYFSS